MRPSAAVVRPEEASDSEEVANARTPNVNLMNSLGANLHLAGSVVLLLGVVGGINVSHY